MQAAKRFAAAAAPNPDLPERTNAMSRAPRTNEETAVGTTRSAGVRKPSRDTQTSPIRQGECQSVGQQTCCPSHQQTAERAREIWQAKGCKPGQDKQNWFEAEAQLKAEAARAVRTM
jgi:hypothetical protein